MPDANVSPRLFLRLFPAFLFVLAFNLAGCGTAEQGTAIVSPAKESNIPPIPPGLKGKAAQRAAAPDGRPRGQHLTTGS